MDRFVKIGECTVNSLYFTDKIAESLAQSGFEVVRDGDYPTTIYICIEDDSE